MKVNWIEYNKDFNLESSKELNIISDYLLVKYIHTNTDEPQERIGLLRFYKCASGKMCILDGHFYYDYFGWTKILQYCPIEI